MKKELITVDNVNNYISKQDGKLYVFGNRLLTAGAKDELGRRRVSVVYGPEPVAAPVQAPAASCGSVSGTPCGKSHGTCRGGCNCGSAITPGIAAGAPLGSYTSVESLALALATMLKEKYGVTDPAELKELTAKALKAIRDNM
ncbi:MAG: hypothetical protein IIV56_05130 [Mailhella sp.]|jgi:hypothetical protein|nr:hypothetical protein [Mailhella sp.]